jgi:hypothetical protein
MLNEHVMTTILMGRDAYEILAGLKSFLREENDKLMAAMVNIIAIEANKK